jgi:hypothetical protein
MSYPQTACQTTPALLFSGLYLCLYQDFQFVGINVVPISQVFAFVVIVVVVVVVVSCRKLESMGLELPLKV